MRDKQQVLAIWGEPRRQSAAPLAACIEQGDTKHTHSGMQVCDKQQVLAVWGEPRRQSAAPLAACNERGTQNRRIQKCKCAINSRCLPSGTNLGDRALLPWLRAIGGSTTQTHSEMQVCDKQQVLAVWDKPMRQSAAPLAACNEQGDTKQTHSEMQVRDDRRCLPSGVKLGDRALLPWLRVSSKGTQNRRIQECKCEMTAGEVKRQSKLLPCGFVQ